jgi:Fe-S-cluster containining protein
MTPSVLEQLLAKTDEIHARYRAEDDAMANEYHTTCAKGCGACCHFPLISATAGEAFVVYHLLSHMTADTKALNNHLRAYAQQYFRHARVKGGLPFTNEQQFKAFSELNLPCPLFQSTGGNREGHCAAFTVRPLICSYFHSLDNPALCAKKEPHRTYAPAISIGENAVEEMQTFERIILGRSTLGHLPLLLAAMSYAEGQKAFLKTDFHNEETATLPPEEAQWSYDFDLYIELLGVAGYSITENDIHSLLRAQEEMKRNLTEME